MKIHYLILICLFFGNLNQGICQSQNMDDRDSVAMEYIVEAENAVDKGKIGKAKKLYKKAFQTSSSNIFVQQKAMEFFVSQDDYKAAADCITLSGMRNEQYNEKALNLYYKGIIYLHEGWIGVHTARDYFMDANKEIRQSPYPDLNLWSDILVACGYTNIVARGQSADGNGEIFCLIHPRDLIYAYPYFYYSLVYNPENDVAQKNMDTVKAKILEAGWELPDLSGFLLPLDSLPDVSIDSLQQIELNQIDSIRSLNVNLLPKQIGTLINYLNQFDEIVMVVDISGSMEEPVTWDPTKTRFDVMKEITLAMTKRIEKSTFLAATSVGGFCGGIPALYEPIGQADRFKLSNQIEDLVRFGATPLNGILYDSPNLFTSKKNKKTVILISDGMDSCDESFLLCSTANMLNSYNIELSVFSFLLEGENFESNFAYEIYECMTEISKGKIFSLDEEGKLEEKLIDEMKNNVDYTLPHLKRSYRLKSHEFMYEFDIKPQQKRIKLSTE